MVKSAEQSTSIQNVYACPVMKSVRQPTRTQNNKNVYCAIKARSTTKEHRRSLHRCWS